MSAGRLVNHKAPLEHGWNHLAVGPKGRLSFHPNDTFFLGYIEVAGVMESLIPITILPPPSFETNSNHFVVGHQWACEARHPGGGRFGQRCQMRQAGSQIRRNNRRRGTRSPRLVARRCRPCPCSPSQRWWWMARYRVTLSRWWLLTSAWEGPSRRPEGGSLAMKALVSDQLLFLSVVVLFINHPPPPRPPPYHISQGIPAEFTAIPRCGVTTSVAVLSIPNTCVVELFTPPPPTHTHTRTHIYQCRQDILLPYLEAE